MNRRHISCGVIRGALNPEPLNEFINVAAWLRYARVGSDAPHADDEIILRATERNVIAQLQNIRSHPIVAARMEEGNLSLHGWVYHIGEGLVTSYDAASGRFVLAQPRDNERVKQRTPSSL